jgi:hypothetical protein
MIDGGCEDNMKIVLSGWLYAEPNRYEPATPRLTFIQGSNTDYWIEQGLIPLCEHVIDVDAPEIDLVEGQVQCLLAKRKKLTAEYEAEATRIDDALAQLKCLTFDEKGIAA